MGPIEEPDQSSEVEKAVASAFGRHDVDVAAALKSGDADAVKQTYRSLGAYLAETVGEDTSEVPLLSRPETTPVVVRLVPPSARVVLDAGCGPRPAAAIELTRRGHRVVAVDLGHGMVSLACRIARENGTPLIGVVADIERLPFRSRSFDAVVCDDTIEHLPDDRRGVSEIAAATKPDGTIVFATPNRRELRVLLRKARDRLHGRRLPPSAYYAVESHLREYTHRELSTLLSSSMVVTRSGTTRFGTTTVKARIASVAVRLGPLRRFGPMVVLVASPRS